MKSIKNWVVAYTRPKHEKTAKKLLEKKGFTVLLPFVKKKRKWSDRTKWVNIPLFPCYIFVKCRLNESILILQTQGIVQIVNFNGKTAIISNNEIIALQGITKNIFKPEPIDYFIKGKKVLVIDGPLKDYQGEIIKLDNNENKLILRIETIKRSLVIRIDKNRLKNINLSK